MSKGRSGVFDDGEVHFRAAAGVTIGHCMQRAALVSLTEERNVVFVHNDKTYRVLFNDLMGVIKAIDRGSP